MDDLVNKKRKKGREVRWARKLFFIFCIAYGPGSFLFAQTTENTPLWFIIEPYLQQVTDTSFHVMWETSASGKGAVRLGVAEFNVLKPNLNRTFCERDATAYHDVTASGLKKGEFYFYQAYTLGKTGDTLAGPVTPLHIPDYGRMPVTFAVIGDTQNSPIIWGRLAQLIYQEQPCFIVHVGDLVQYGPNKNDWVDEFFKPARNLLRFYPLYPAIGNHEMHHEWFFRYFDLPAPEWFYTLKKGNVLFVFVDTNRDILPGSEQYHKLERILASSSETWKIMVHHQPVYVSDEGSYGNTWFQRSVHGDPNEMHLKKLYDMYGVDLELNGHIHTYERTWPLRADSVDMKNGVTYITTGGGNDEYGKDGANKAWYDARTRVTNHFLYISIVGDNLYGRAIDSTGNVFDDWTFEKPGFVRINAPYITGNNQYFIDSTQVSVQNLNAQGTIYYRENNEQYRAGDPLSTKEVCFVLDKTTTVSGYIRNGNLHSPIAEKTFEKLPLYPSAKKGEKGVKASYYEGNWIALPDFKKEKALRFFSLDSLTLTDIQPRSKDHFAVRFTGSFIIPETSVYRFLLESFDGSRLIVDGKEVITNDGIHYEIKKENFIALGKGWHSFEVQYFHYVRRATLNIWLAKENEPMKNFNEFIKTGKHN